MTPFLVLILIGLLVSIFYLGIQTNTDKKNFQSKTQPLELFLTKLSLETAQQVTQIQVSEELSSKLREVNHVLNKNIFELNYQLIEDLYPKNKR